MPERSTLVLAILLLSLAVAACESPGTVRLTTRTSGDTLDSDGYTVRLAPADSASEDRDGAEATDTTVALRADGSAAVGGLAPATYRVRIEGVQRNCGPEGEDPREVAVPEGDTTTVAFRVVCAPALLDRIVFVSERDGDPPDRNEEIYVIGPDGSGLARLTHNSEGFTLDLDWMPLVSPRGRRVAFVSRRDGNEEIYVMAADGTGATRLSHGDGRDWGPSFSPDGETVYYGGFRSVSNPLPSIQRNVYRVSASGGKSTQIGQGMSPVVSPDGGTVLVDREGLLATDPDGSNAREIVSDTLFSAIAAWLPDGSRIVFSGEREGNADLYVVNADGSGVTRLTDDPATDVTPPHGLGGPVVSPDGDRIAFVSERDGNKEIYVVAPDGTGLARLTRSEGLDGYPAFSPDGDRIAFASERDGNFDIYTIGVDGSGLTRLTDHPAPDTDPDWAPGR